MKILITGAGGVIGDGVLPPLLDRGHTIRLFARSASAQALRWPQQVEAFAGDLTNPSDIEGAATGCDLVIHIAGTAEENPPEQTFERLNVDGTRFVVREAERAGVSRFIFLSSLGAHDGKSRYHESKRKAEEIVREFEGSWLILRPGNVYGPKDEVITTLVTMVRTLPAVPLVGTGDQRFQPIWFQDLGNAIARAVDDRGTKNETLTVAGSDVVTFREVIEKLQAITGRSVPLLPIPEALVEIGTDLAAAFGLDVPVNESKLTMLEEENIIEKPHTNALIGRFGIEPLPLDDGLQVLVDSLPEQLPSQGSGPLTVKTWSALVASPCMTMGEVLRQLQTEWNRITPISFGVEPGSRAQIEEGATLTARLQNGVHIAVRAIEANDRRVTLAALKGHPIAGVVQFYCEGADRGFRFVTRVISRPARPPHLAAMAVAGSPLQSETWSEVVTKVARLSGDDDPSVESEETVLDDSEAATIEAEIDALLIDRDRSAHAR